MKIATWNINGIKARLSNLLIWLKQEQPDIVCLQEIKSIDSLFPSEQIADLGYHIETYGQKSFNGVALLSKVPPDDVLKGLPFDDSKSVDSQARFIEGVYSTKNAAIRVISLYLPNGNPVLRKSESTLPLCSNNTNQISKKYQYKLNWMKNFYEFVLNRLSFEEPLILAGDYNVIPNKKDAAYTEQWLNDALYLPDTRKAYNRLINLGLTDSIRAVSDEIGYSFWDYQAGAWRKNNGIRIDHLLLSPEAANKLQNAYIQKEVRSWEKASDHVPVCIELDI